MSPGASQQQINLLFKRKQKSKTKQTYSTFMGGEPQSVVTAHPEIYSWTKQNYLRRHLAAKWGRAVFSTVLMEHGASNTDLLAPQRPRRCLDGGLSKKKKKKTDNEKRKEKSKIALWIIKQRSDKCSQPQKSRLWDYAYRWWLKSRYKYAGQTETHRYTFWYGQAACEETQNLLRLSRKLMGRPLHVHVKDPLKIRVMCRTHLWFFCNRPQTGCVFMWLKIQSCK